jgi:hypothetical protein
LALFIRDKIKYDLLVYSSLMSDYIINLDDYEIDKIQHNGESLLSDDEINKLNKAITDRDQITINSLILKIGIS